MIYIASDHGGFEMKKALFEYIQRRGFDVTDLGPETLDPNDDYPDYAIRMAKAMQNEDDLGVLICRSGEGMVMTANKAPHIRAFIGFGERVTAVTKSNDWGNVLCIPSDYISLDEARRIIDAFLDTKRTDVERHVRRVKKISWQP